MEIDFTSEVSDNAKLIVEKLLQEHSSTFIINKETWCKKIIISIYTKDHFILYIIITIFFQNCWFNKFNKSFLVKISRLYWYTFLYFKWIQNKLKNYYRWVSHNSCLKEMFSFFSKIKFLKDINNSHYINFFLVLRDQCYGNKISTYIKNWFITVERRSCHGNRSWRFMYSK